MPTAMQSGKDLVKILVIDVGGTYVKVLAIGAQGTAARFEPMPASALIGRPGFTKKGFLTRLCVTT